MTKLISAYSIPCVPFLPPTSPDSVNRRSLVFSGIPTPSDEIRHPVLRRKFYFYVLYNLFEAMGIEGVITSCFPMGPTRFSALIGAKTRLVKVVLDNSHDAKFIVRQVAAMKKKVPFPMALSGISVRPSLPPEERPRRSQKMVHPPKVSPSEQPMEMDTTADLQIETSPTAVTPASVPQSTPTRRYRSQSVDTGVASCGNWNPPPLSSTQPLTVPEIPSGEKGNSGQRRVPPIIIRSPLKKTARVVGQTVASQPSTSELSPRIYSALGTPMRMQPAEVRGGRRTPSKNSGKRGYKRHH